MKKCKKCGTIEASDLQTVCEKCLCSDFEIVGKKKETEQTKKKK